MGRRGCGVGILTTGLESMSEKRMYRVCLQDRRDEARWSISPRAAGTAGCSLRLERAWFRGQKRHAKRLKSDGPCFCLASQCRRGPHSARQCCSDYLTYPRVHARAEATKPARRPRGVVVLDSRQRDSFHLKVTSTILHYFCPIAYATVLDAHRSNRKERPTCL